MDSVTWFSHPVDDMTRASRFYENAFGWRIMPETAEPDPVYSYHVALNSDSDGRVPHERGRVNGCLVRRDIGLTHPAVLIRVDNLPDSVARVRAAGGRTIGEVTPMASLNGSFVLIEDTEGNVIELFADNGNASNGGANNDNANNDNANKDDGI